MTRNVLIIEDDVKICDLLVGYLARHDLQGFAVQKPSIGIQHIEKGNVEVVILDVMLPEFDGFETLKRIRSFSDIPVIMLTARGETADKILGLELGADDYMSKPFEPRELVARINSILRRRTFDKSAAKKIFGELQIDKDLRQVHLEGRLVELTSLEFDLLDLLSEKKEKNGRGMRL
ncbi:MAG: response regulator transcription factor [Bdellovibrionales bacterium]